MKSVPLVLLLVAAATACMHGPDPSQATEFADQKLAGKIGGKAWTFKYAYVDPTIDTPEEDDYVFVFLPSKPAEPCPRDGDAGLRAVMVSAPKTAGKATPLKKGSTRNLVFHSVENGAPVASAALRGKIKINAADSKTVKGRLLGALDGKNYVNGDFVATVCEVGDMDKVNPWEAQ
jgi:hypothetical protein